MLANSLKSKALPYVICALAAMFYLYEFTLQVSPSVMTSELMRDFDLNAASLGTVAAFYYYAYTPMQLPAGLLYDRFGPRRLITLAVLVCAVGAFFFSLTNSATMASAGRFFMGIGSAFSFIGALLLVARWFPPQYFAVLAGAVQLMSCIGAICGQIPLASAVEAWGWRYTMMGIGLFGILLSGSVWLIVRDSPEELKTPDTNAAQPQKISELKRLAQVCRNSQTWLCCVYSFLVWAPIAAFAALWGVPFIVAAYNISTQAASIACSMIWIGIGITCPLIGWISDRIGLRRPLLVMCGAIGCIALTCTVYIPHLPMPVFYILLFFIGAAGAGQSLAFAVVKENNLPNTAGTAMGFNNMATVAGGAIFQPLVGLFLHLNWHGVTHNGVPIYGSADYRAALFSLPICYALAMLVSAKFLRETFCKSIPVE